MKGHASCCWPLCTYRKDALSSAGVSRLTRPELQVAACAARIIHTFKERHAAIPVCRYCPRGHRYRLCSKQPHSPHIARAGCACRYRLECRTGRAEGAEDARFELDGYIGRSVHGFLPIRLRQLGEEQSDTGGPGAMGELWHAGGTQPVAAVQKSRGSGEAEPEPDPAGGEVRRFLRVVHECRRSEPEGHGAAEAGAGADCWSDGQEATGECADRTRA